MTFDNTGKTNASKVDICAIDICDVSMRNVGRGVIPCCFWRAIVFWLLFLLVGVVFLLCSFLVQRDAENRSRPYWQPYWQAGIFFRDSFIIFFASDNEK